MFIAREAAPTREAGTQTVEREQFVLVEDESGTVFRALAEVQTSADEVAEALHLFAVPSCQKRELVVFRYNNEIFGTGHKWSTWRPKELPGKHISTNLEV